MYGFSSLKNLLLFCDQARACKHEFKFGSSSLKEERKIYFASECNHVVEAFNADDPKALHKSVAKVLHISRSHIQTQKSTRVADNLGNIAQSVVEEQHIFRDHFAPFLGGFAGSSEALVVKDRAATANRLDDASLVNFLCVSPPPRVYLVFTKP